MSEYEDLIEASRTNNHALVAVYARRMVQFYDSESLIAITLRACERSIVALLHEREQGDLNDLRRFENGEINQDRVDHSIASDSGRDEDAEHACCLAIEEIQDLLLDAKTDDVDKLAFIRDVIERVIDNDVTD